MRQRPLEVLSGFKLHKGALHVARVVVLQDQDVFHLLAANKSTLNPQMSAEGKNIIVQSHWQSPGRMPGAHRVRVVKVLSQLLSRGVVGQVADENFVRRPCRETGCGEFGFRRRPGVAVARQTGRGPSRCGWERRHCT